MTQVQKIDPPMMAAQEITPMSMIDRAVQSGASVEHLEKLMALQERWEANQGRKAFDSAISAAKASIPPIVKDGKGHNEKKYATLAGIARVVDPILSEHGLSYRFRTSQDERIHVTCVLSHRDGHSEESSLSGPADTSGSKNAVQAIGSTLTYLQRYTLVQALGLSATEDDDGREAGGDRRINADQFIALQGLIEETEADVPKLLKFLGAEDIESLTLRQFDTAMSALRKKKSQVEAGK